MKVGILTQPIGRNYGGILQNWALQQVLKNIGHNPEMIWRYYNIPPYNFKLIPRRIASFIKCIYRKYLKNNPNDLISNPFSREYSAFPQCMDYEFINQIVHTCICRNDEELRNIVKKGNYDAFIVGSDQVWRTQYSPHIETYFLDFLSEDDHRKRIAYAASFGVENDYMSETEIEKCKPLLKRFDAVSVREYSAIEILKSRFERKNGFLALDPTLLLEREVYESRIVGETSLETKGLACYVLDETADTRLISADIARAYSIDVMKYSIEYENGKMLTVPEWLAVIKDSRFIITDSFHGILFSIIFNKDFIAISNKGRGQDRFKSILNQLDLNDRLVDSYSDFESRREFLLSPIEYDSINSKLSLLRGKSIDWLRKALYDSED